ncbi:MAG: hypothetical protein WA658_05365, partial [Candidatus Acidiferrales bacterium]
YHSSRPFLIITPRDWKTLYLIENKHSAHFLIVIFCRVPKDTNAESQTRIALGKSPRTSFLIDDRRY